MKHVLSASIHTWVLKEPFIISRGAIESVDVVVVRIELGGKVGRGEARGVPYDGETPELMLEQIQSVRHAIEAGVARSTLLHLLPAGGARNAVDAALWDLEARQAGVPVWRLASLAPPRPTASAITIGVRSLAAYEERARTLSACPWIKVKVTAEAPLDAIAAVRRGAPGTRLIVDPNQAWSVEQLVELTPRLAKLGVDLLEQPIAAAGDECLQGLQLAVPLCADEAVNTIDDLPRIAERYDFINIKLDKAGGLTAALQLAHAARDKELRLMVGCMTGSSLAMAPALLLAQLCEVVDLDGPLLLDGDWTDGLTYSDGVASVPSPALWGF